MSINKAELAQALNLPHYPRSTHYDPDWVLTNLMGPNVLWLAEALTEKMSLKPGMRVLDMGCGKAISSIFLAKEFGVQVWATDLWIGATENWERIVAAGVQDRVFPIHAEAHTLPFAEGFFDAAVSLDAYQYFGTDDLYLGYFSKFICPGGELGMIAPGVRQEFEVLPEHLAPYWGHESWSYHSPQWWRQHLTCSPNLGPPQLRIQWQAGGAMKGKQYTEQQMLDILGQVEAGQPIGEVARTAGIAVSTIHRWKARYGGMTKDETKRFRQLEEENRRLKKLVADLSLDNVILKEVVAKKW